MVPQWTLARVVDGVSIGRSNWNPSDKCPSATAQSFRPLVLTIVHVRHYNGQAVTGQRTAYQTSCSVNRFINKFIASKDKQFINCLTVAVWPCWPCSSGISYEAIKCKVLIKLICANRPSFAYRGAARISVTAILEKWMSPSVQGTPMRAVGLLKFSEIQRLSLPDFKVCRIRQQW